MYAYRGTCHDCSPTSRLRGHTVKLPQTGTILVAPLLTIVVAGQSGLFSKTLP
jgi:hypothetical protein